MVGKRRRSEGAVQLGRLGRTDEEMAARLGVPRPQVTYWKNGTRVPSATSRARLERELGIPAASWDAMVAPTAKVTASTPIDYDPVPPPSDDGSVRAKAARLDRLVRSMLAAIEKSLDGVDANSTVDLMLLQKHYSLARDAHSLLDKLGRLTGESQQIPETRVMRLPAWRRIQARVLEALKPHPKALAAVVGALQELGGEA